MNPPSRIAWTVALVFLGLCVLWTIFPDLTSYHFWICATVATLATVKVRSGPLSTFWRVLFSILAGLGGFLVGLYVVIFTAAKAMNDPKTGYAAWCHSHFPAGLALFGCLAGFAILFFATYKWLLHGLKD